MTSRIVFSEHAPKPIGPYSQAIDTGNLIFTAGQIGISPETGDLVSGGISEETRQVFENLRAVLSASGSSLSKALKVTVYLKNLNDFPAMNHVYKEFFATDPPPRTTIGVANLPKGAGVEIDIIAQK